MGSPSPSLPPVPASGHDATVVAVVFIFAILALSGLLWWQVRVAYRRQREEAGEGPWPSDGPPTRSPR